MEGEWEFVIQPIFGSSPQYSSIRLFWDTAHEIHTGHIARDTTYPDSETGGDAGAVGSVAGMRLHPAPDTNFENDITQFEIYFKNPDLHMGYEEDIL